MPRRRAAPGRAGTRHAGAPLGEQLGLQAKVRLIGVDTPETVDPRKPVQYFGHEASAFTTRRLQGKQVQLAYD